MEIRSNTRFVFEKNNGAFFLGPFLNLRKFLFFPILNGFRVSLIRSIQWFLTGKTQLVQNRYPS